MNDSALWHLLKIIFSALVILTSSYVSLIAASVEAPVRKFYELGLFEQKAFTDEMKKRDGFEIFQTMIEAGIKDGDRTKELVLRDLLIMALRDPRFVEVLPDTLGEFALGRQNPPFERQLAVSTLGAAETPEALKVLLSLIPRLSEVDLKRLAWEAIGYLGRGNARANAALSPPLEKIWDTTQDQEQLARLAKGIAQLGSASGISLLLRSALGEQDNAHRRASFGVLISVQLSNPEAVSPLVDYLNSRSSTRQGRKLVEDALARMPRTTGAKAALEAYHQSGRN